MPAVWLSRNEQADANTPTRLKYGGFKGERARVYRKRTSVERFFSMLKSFFGLIQRGTTGFDRARKWLKLAVLASLVVGWANHQNGEPVHSVKAFASPTAKRPPAGAAFAPSGLPTRPAPSRRHGPPRAKL